MRMILSLLVAVLWLASAAMAQGPKPKDEGWSELLPPGEGRAQVLEGCTSCHNLKSTVHERKNRAGWNKTVADMIQRGAQLFPEEIEPITSYLAKAFSPDVPKPVNVNTATREELEKLPSLKPETAARILEARGKAGSFKSAAELRDALGKPGDFDKYRYLLKYKN